jgi:aminotransferase
MRSLLAKQLARRTESLRQSDIRAITAMVREVDGINLGQGICDLPTPDPIKRGAQEAIEADRSIYSPYAGIERLREAIAGKARAYNGLPVSSADEVMVSVGSTGAFVAAALALLDPGDEVILFEPFYGYHRNLLTLLGATPRFVPTRGPSWAVDFDEVAGAITPRTKAIVINTPGNPSGKVWTREELAAILALMEKHNLYAVTDEIYEYMVYDGRQHVSLAALPGAYERTVTISGFSKTYNMTGWRLGYAVGPEALVGPMGLINDLLYICAPTPLQHGVAEAFGMRDAYFTEMLGDYSRKRQLLCETLEAVGFDVPWPQGAYYALASFAPLTGVQGGFEDDRAACETLLRKARVAAVPGSSFFQHPEDGRHYLRFCFAKEFPVLEEACTQLRDAFGS